LLLYELLPGSPTGPLKAAASPLAPEPEPVGVVTETLTVAVLPDEVDEPPVAEPPAADPPDPPAPPVADDVALAVGAADVPEPEPCPDPPPAHAGATNSVAISTLRILVFMAAPSNILLKSRRKVTFPPGFWG
jgi:hypothetical protein